MAPRKRSPRKKGGSSDAAAPAEVGSPGSDPPDATGPGGSSPTTGPAPDAAASTAAEAPGSPDPTGEAPTEGSDSGSGPGIARAIEESFEQLGKKVGRIRVRRGTVTQPPPAWQPDEVTLGFAMVSDETGAMHELPEPTVLATIFVSVETDRRRLLNQLAGRGDEEIEAVANLYWPLIVLPGPHPPEVAIFDGTGVWKRSFRYTLPPTLEHVQSLLETAVPPTEYLARMRQLTPQFAYDPGAEVFTVEGFLPVDPPLLFDVLSHSEFRSDPQSPHAGFLPARHEVGWYVNTAREMQRWLDRFDADLRTLSEFREKLRGVLTEGERRLDEEYIRLQAEAQERIREATARSEAEIAELHGRHREEMRQHLSTIRGAQGSLVRGEATVATADALSFRATHRRTQGEAHLARRRQAEDQIRHAQRVTAEAQKEIEKIHARERALLDQAIRRVADVEQQYARALADRELFRDEFSASGVDLLQAIDGQVAARTTQKNLLAGYFIPVANLAGVRVVWFPLWLATLRGPRGVRQLVFPPMQVRAEKRLGQSLKQFLGGVVLPLEPRTAQFDKVLRATMEEALRKDPWLSTATQELTRAADVLVDPDVLHRVKLGLRELKQAGWITPKQEQNFFEASVARSQRRAIVTAETPYTGPTGAVGGTVPPRPESAAEPAKRS